MSYWTLYMGGWVGGSLFNSRKSSNAIFCTSSTEKRGERSCG